MIRRIAWVLLPALILLASCQEKKQEKAALVYKTMKVERTSQAVKVGYSATMKGREIVEIRPQVSGLITKILTSEGQKVQKGQTLFIIDQVPYVAALNTAESALKSAKAAEATAQLSYQLRQQETTAFPTGNQRLRPADSSAGTGFCSGSGGSGSGSGGQCTQQPQLHGGEESRERRGRYDSLPCGSLGEQQHSRAPDIRL